MITIRAEDATGPLSDLKSRLDSIIDLFDPYSDIYYIDYPVHNNVGDMLINIGTEQFFRDHHVSIHKRYSILDIPDAAHWELKKNATLLFHGGGNLGDLYPPHQNVRERLIDAFPHVRTIFLPQSLYFSSEEMQRTFLLKIAKHTNYHILVRDRESLDVLRRFEIAHASMMPDMAHQLWENLRVTAPPQRGRDLYFLRRDKEATLPPPALTSAFAQHSIDWSDLVSLRHRIRARMVYSLLNAGGRIAPKRTNAYLWYQARNGIVNDAISGFLRYDRIYTNRLHAMLLALLLHRDVVAFDNTYGKSSRYINAWLPSATHHEKP